MICSKPQLLEYGYLCVFHFSRNKIIIMYFFKSYCLLLSNCSASKFETLGIEMG